MNHSVCPLETIDRSTCQLVIRPGKIRDAENIGLLECINCKIVIHDTDLRHAVDYTNGSMHSWAAGYGGMLESPRMDISRRVDAIHELAKNETLIEILDYGCGNGQMLEALKASFKIVGYEPEQSAREACIARGEMVYADLESLLQQSGTFDLITLFHVVEHFYNPHAEFENIAKLLKPGGMVLIETPNSQDALLTMYKSEEFSNFTYWSHHPILHSNRSLAAILNSQGFELILDSQIQRYGLENHLYWLSKGLPGGHHEWEGLFSNETNLRYEMDLRDSGTADTVWIVAKRI